MLEIVLASQNKGKLVEIQSFFKSFKVRFIPQEKFSIPSVEETGMTFVENAIIKARHAMKYLNLPVLADDSGLTVLALNSAPGVFSSRYAGDYATDIDRMQKILRELEKAKNPDRTANFHCVLALMTSAKDPAPFICHGIWEGEIANEPKGENGFGYDPIFYVPTYRCTAAELNFKEKNVINHRGQALRNLLVILKSKLYPI
ncbi:RdgB/HAM1 family non-canonical purine NTP pyrophosphatase [Coxiella endosymbiont of Amblyomma americanum]|uniref:RdgB/HAM1 family non-canonical purine NTP pyrophosphatase n=1 Tax=Coxiella endosymbiont of Amblyomma americanum TaxID=325775 RepID=UPI0005807F90|nr:RdgB/HAM1 family non-canonical purine NTP pyrophosphatase [Coxiella endosymbiont of Amblyomma americanum]AJC50374.1 nucleoside-triphosphate diphosphatase [Coxiella endosymbiont of Amblyomma americanum]AUJ58717.1 non-canonical purine NTP pyrophosphatase [Coxiella-like endosymbiont of Amblyomma americanum]